EMADAVNKQASSGLEIEFHAGMLLTKELEVINAVKSGNIAIGDPGGAAATVFPEMGVFLVPYLVKSYDQAYKMFNGAIGDRLDRQFQDKYKLKVLCFYDTASAISGTTAARLPHPRICAASNCA